MESSEITFKELSEPYKKKLQTILNSYCQAQKDVESQRATITQMQQSHELETVKLKQELQQQASKCEKLTLINKNLTLKLQSAQYQLQNQKPDIEPPKDTKSRSVQTNAFQQKQNLQKSLSNANIQTDFDADLQTNDKKRLQQGMQQKFQSNQKITQPRQYETTHQNIQRTDQRYKQDFEPQNYSGINQQQQIQYYEHQRYSDQSILQESELNQSNSYDPVHAENLRQLAQQKIQEMQKSMGMQTSTVPTGVVSQYKPVPSLNLPRPPQTHHKQPLKVEQVPKKDEPQMKHSPTYEPVTSIKEIKSQNSLLDEISSCLPNFDQIYQKLDSKFNSQAKQELDTENNDNKSIISQVQKESTNQSFIPTDSPNNKFLPRPSPSPIVKLTTPVVDNGIATQAKRYLENSPMKQTQVPVMEITAQRRTSNQKKEINSPEHIISSNPSFKSEQKTEVNSQQIKQESKSDRQNIQETNEPKVEQKQVKTNPVSKPLDQDTSYETKQVSNKVQDQKQTSSKQKQFFDLEESDQQQDSKQEQPKTQKQEPKQEQKRLKQNSPQEIKPDLKINEINNKPFFTPVHLQQSNLELSESPNIELVQNKPFLVNRTESQNQIKSSLGLKSKISMKNSPFNKSIDSAVLDQNFQSALSIEPDTFQVSQGKIYFDESVNQTKQKLNDDVKENKERKQNESKKEAKQDEDKLKKVRKSIQNIDEEELDGLLMLLNSGAI
ncbi:Hypothetical_protein [Hexamita inflata]|uniref:Hypothetical_protein n=1 Tax=Hexamita inflata TaxID=28002 RepID=A0AA86RL56_9EUKA|nr:Hypothetical protein HINF_LOCUS64256 [Hexamita inflata]